MPTSVPRTAVSAPGKVLLAGGYLALDRAYTGLVYGLSARINAVAQNIETSAGVQLSEIVVSSPQFLEAEWRYGYHLAPDNGGIKVTQLMVGSTMKPNAFVETALTYALTYIVESAAASKQPAPSLAPTRITILADNDYYSSSSSSSSSSGGRFAHFGTTLGSAHKTGLGSSAAMVTSLTAALLSHYLPASSGFDLSAPAAGSDAGVRSRAILHNLAQAAHCAAQGKVGSGFDVAAAVYGSCRYRRFSPEVLTSLPEAGSPGFARALLRCVEDDDDDGAGKIWDTEISKSGVTLPRGVALRMCDVDCGSQTVGMVKSVLAWRAANPARAAQLWDDLQVKNQTLAGVLSSQDDDPSSSSSSSADSAEGQQQQQQQQQLDPASLPSAIERAVSSIRDLVRAMGAEAAVPIEPESQTALLDALATEVDGVYNGVVPGAGGFDALALLVRDDDETEAAIREFLGRWSSATGGGDGEAAAATGGVVGGATARGTVRLLDVKGQMDGVRTEEVVEGGVYEGWLA